MSKVNDVLESRKKLIEDQAEEYTYTNYSIGCKLELINLGEDKGWLFRRSKGNDIQELTINSKEKPTVLSHVLDDALRNGLYKLEFLNKVEESNE